ncbi:IS66 family transposase [Shewanella sp. SM20]|uniref:IS66 family transposase n=1 Tax=Shewanella sp. SM20 TaxID=2912792 RepID=UPI0021D8B956|nr:IS66 family transposase [Shewanella sp. SM20]MCU8094341.1 IS66 family transposase [Shewanella sp. SM20]
MKFDLKNLPDDPALLKKIILQQQSKLLHLEELFRLAQQKQFGKSAEGYPSQAELFNEAEVEVETLEAEDVAKVSKPRRKKPVRKPLPAELPREVVIHDISAADKVCDCCGNDLHQMGEEKSEKLEFVPAQVKVIEHVRLKYSCRVCDKHSTEVKIKIAPVPASPIPKGIATASLLSQIITSKYQYGLPLYRQESLFQQYGIELSRKTMADWILKCGELLLPLYDKLCEILLQQAVIQADETTVNVLKEDKATCYMWLYVTGTDTPNNQGIPNIVLYDYQPSRAGQCAVDFLDGFSGYLQVDGYAGYAKTDAELVGCWAHARRKFTEAEIAQPKGKTGKANWALNHIQKIYRIETLNKDSSPEVRRQQRQLHSQPLLDELHRWLEKSQHHVPPKSSLGKAITYCLNQWPNLNRYLEDGRLNIDNNRAERAIKPFVIGRKNWLFANTANGAKASAILYSMIETAKANGLMPFDYLMYCLEQLSLKPESLDHLLPWNAKLG